MHHYFVSYFYTGCGALRPSGFGQLNAHRATPLDNYDEIEKLRQMLTEQDVLLGNVVILNIIPLRK